jgi:hypothetical protein
MIEIGYVSFTLKEEEWQDQVEKKIGMIIWFYLFNNWEVVGKAMRDGFFQALKICSCIHPHKGEHVESYEALDFRHSTQDCVKLTTVVPLPFQQKIDE